MNTCQHCTTQFKPKPNTRGLFCSMKCVGLSRINVWQDNKVSTERTKYELDPKVCPQCNSTIPYKSRFGKFCSKSCAALINNQYRTKASRQKQKHTIQEKFQGPVITRYRKECLLDEYPSSAHSTDTLQSKLSPHSRKIAGLSGPFTKIFLRTCPYSGKVFYTKNPAERYSKAALENMKIYRVRCRFKFAFKNYANFFLDRKALLKNHGWYRPANSPKPNLYGVTRDHLFSVHDGFILGVPPEIISHPANCRLILSSDNSRKGKSSSITLSELLMRIVEFDSKPAAWF